MPYIIDGHNLIGQLSDISLSDMDDEQLLLSMLEVYFKGIRKKAFVYFDQGSLLGGREYSSAFLEVKFVRFPKTADEAIIEKLKSLKGNAKNFHIVSSDNWVINNSQKLGAKVISSEFFGRKIIEKNRIAKKKNTTNDDNVEYWLNIFESDS